MAESLDIARVTEHIIIGARIDYTFLHHTVEQKVLLSV